MIINRFVDTNLDFIALDVRALGGSGSGNFGHRGRPGEVGGSATAGFVPASAEQRKALGLPPAWKDVMVNPDPQGSLQAVGRDIKGRTQYRYSAEHSAGAKAAKFERMKAFNDALPALRERIAQDLKSEDPLARESAEVLHLIDTTGFRVGSDTDTLADKKAFGATTLQARHVKLAEDKVSFRFTAKKGVEIAKTVRDQQLVALIREKMAGKSGKDSLFMVKDHQIRDYMNEHAEGFTPKDFRTRHATAMAAEMVAKQKTPSSMKEFKAARREVGQRVAKFLGNTHTVALASYINPVVFAKWEKRVH